MCPHGSGSILKHSVDLLDSYCQILSKLTHFFEAWASIYPQRNGLWPITVTIAAEPAVSPSLHLPLSLFTVIASVAIIMILVAL